MATLGTAHTAVPAANTDLDGRGGHTSASSAIPPPLSPLPTLLKASWGAGALGATAMLYLVNMFVVYFLVRHVGIPVAVAGILLALTRVYDALVNPLIGALSDRTQTRWGRRRPWMAVGAIVCPTASIALFNIPDGLSPSAGYSLVLATLLLYCTGYSLFSVPYSAQGAEMTDHYADRASVMAWRTFFSYVAGLAVVAGAPALIESLGGGRPAYARMSLGAAAVIGGSMLWAALFTHQPPAPARRGPRVPPLRALRTAFANRPFMLILSIKMTLQLGLSFSGASILFLLVDVLGRDEGALALFGVVSNVAGIAAVPMWNKLLHRFERRTLYACLMALHAPVYLSWFLASPAELQAAFLLRAFLLGALGSGSVLVSMSMLADTMELDRLTTGQRREGLFVGALELVQTTSFVLGPLLVGIAFSAAGLVAGEAGRAAQPASALLMIRLAMSAVPATCSAIGFGLLMLYRLDAARLARVRHNATMRSHATGPRA